MPGLIQCYTYITRKCVVSIERCLIHALIFLLCFDLLQICFSVMVHPYSKIQYAFDVYVILCVHVTLRSVSTAACSQLVSVILYNRHVFIIVLYSLNRLSINKYHMFGNLLFFYLSLSHSSPLFLFQAIHRAFNASDLSNTNGII